MKQFTGKRAALHNLGCKVNAYETDSMAALLKQAGFEIVPFSEPADVYVINTCSVTNIADRKSRQMIHRARKMNPGAVVIAAGCYVQTAIDKTGLQIDADIILGTGRKQEIVHEIERFEERRETESHEEVQERLPETGKHCRADLSVQSVVDVADLRKLEKPEKMVLPKVEGHTRAYIKVQDGCDMYCSYCIIPYARGHVRSRKMEDIVQELTHLAEEGTSEVVLTGIHLSSYGVDFPESDGSTWQERSRLIELVERVAGIAGIERIRLGSLEPTIITEETAARLSQIGKLCPHFHLSLQSGSDTVLNRMNRHYTTKEYSRCVSILRKYFDKPALTTDIIVGFPQETEQEFLETVEYLREIQLYETHVFRYSRRAGTRADRMEGQITEAVKARRAQVLENLNRENQISFIAGKNGARAEVLVEERYDASVPNAAQQDMKLSQGMEAAVKLIPDQESSADGNIVWYAGYTKDYIRVAVPSATDIRGRIIRGSLAVESSASLV